MLSNERWTDFLNADIHWALCDEQMAEVNSINPSSFRDRRSQNNINRRSLTISKNVLFYISILDLFQFTF